MFITWIWVCSAIRGLVVMLDRRVVFEEPAEREWMTERLFLSLGV
jgi:hypothetical protein